jgi:hypothetical protein
MRRARADDSFTWEPFDNGRQGRITALVVVGLCAGFVGLVVGRVSSGGTVESARKPPPSAVTTNKDQAAAATRASPPVLLANPATELQTGNTNKQIPSRPPEPMSLPVHPERQTLSAPVPTVGKPNDQAVPPPSPPVVLLNPGNRQQNGDIRERPVPEQARERPHSLATVPTSEKRNEPEVGPARAAPRVVQRPVPSNANEEDRQPSRRYQKANDRSTSVDAIRSRKSRASTAERSATFADYGALRDYMMRR